PRRDVVERLEDVGDRVELAALHLVQVLLVPALPVARCRETPVAQSLHEARDVLSLSQSAQADQTRVAGGNHHPGIVGQETEMIEASRSHRLRLKALADLLDHGNPVIGVDDLLSHLESHSVLLKERKEPDPGAANYREKRVRIQTTG